MRLGAAGKCCAVLGTEADWEKLPYCSEERGLLCQLKLTFNELPIFIFTSLGCLTLFFFFFINDEVIGYSTGSAPISTVAPRQLRFLVHPLRTGNVFVP